MGRALVVIGVITLLVAWTVGSVYAWQCPLVWRSAEEAIKKAEAMNMPPEGKALLTDAKRLVAESKKHHLEGNAKIDHAHSMWKAKAAQAQAEAAQTIATP
ncbi:MAG TPA: hypothetical protein VGT02_14355 [Methylomirabilota bacterium]|nr:hypothetical protein [Methylomirabilota bacterium]